MSRPKVTLRKKKISNGKQSLYLDFYPEILKNDGKRSRREFLGIYIYEKPKNPSQRKENQINLELANQIRDKRNIQLINREYGFKDNITYSVALSKVYQEVVDLKQEQNSQSNYLAWQASSKVFKSYFNDMLTTELTIGKVESYKKYMLKYISKKTKEVISKSTASTYFKHFKEVLNYAYENKMLKDDLSKGVKHISYESKPREVLSLEEIQTLNTIPIKDQEVKNIAFLMLLTGRRFKELQNLKWSNVLQSDNGYFLKIEETKNEKHYNHPISDQAYRIISKQTKINDFIFNIKYSHAYNVLKTWIGDAGITKNITLHNFRHTYATLQLEAGTDIYTVSKLLAHKNVKTTEIYAKVTDKRKTETINKIKIDGL